MKKKPGKYKIAAYIRVSTEEQAENPEGSIKNQEQRLREYVKLKNADGPFGEIVEVFCDAGISAKDMKRPALQRMFSSIRSNEVNLVLVTEISRLSRSIKDFTLIWEFLKDEECQFQSLRDNFDTTTPAGEMILFTLANFAQFERKQLGERISNAFLARAKRGLWNGGVIPLGYELDQEKQGHLKIVESEAKIVREVYETFLKEETLSQTGKRLNDLGVKLPKKPRNGSGFRNAHFTIDALYRMLTNRAYIAKRTFKTDEGEKEIDAVWPAIIDEKKFERIQKMLAKNKSRRKSPAPNRYPYILSGLVLCQTCGDRMSGKSAHGNGGKIGYYEHTWATKSQSCLSKKVFWCEPHRVQAKIIEPAVWQDLQRLLNDQTYRQVIFEEAKAHAKKFSLKNEIDQVQAKITSLQNQLEATTERITQLPKGINANIFFDQILKIQKSKEEFELKLLAIKAENVNCELPLSLEKFEQFTNDLKNLSMKTTDPHIQASICRKLIQKVEVSTAGIVIHYHVGDHHFNNEFDAASTRMVDGELKSKVESAFQGPAEKSVGPFFISRPLQKYSRRGGGPVSQSQTQISYFKGAVDGSNSLTNGRGCKT